MSDESLEAQWLRIAESVRDSQAEPTEAMWQAAWDASEDYFVPDRVTQEGFRRGISAMLAAMPRSTVSERNVKLTADRLCAGWDGSQPGPMNAYRQGVRDMVVALTGEAR